VKCSCGGKLKVEAVREKGRLVFRNRRCLRCAHYFHTIEAPATQRGLEEAYKHVERVKRGK